MQKPVYSLIEDEKVALSPDKVVNQGGDEGGGAEDSEDDYEDDVLEEDDDDDNEDLVEYEGTDYVGELNLSQSEEDVVNPSCTQVRRRVAHWLILFWIK